MSLGQGSRNRRETRRWSSRQELASHAREALSTLGIVVEPRRVAPRGSTSGLGLGPLLELILCRASTAGRSDPLLICTKKMFARDSRRVSVLEPG